jgi:hypothetical protein
MTKSPTIKQGEQILEGNLSEASWRWPTLVALLLLQLWSAHAIAFFLHEYAHSFTA